MKLAFCLFKYFPYGGLQRDFLRIANATFARGHDIHVYTMDWQGDAPDGLHIHQLPTKGWQNHTKCHHFSKLLLKELEKTAYDLVVGFNKMPGLDVYFAADGCFKARFKATKPAIMRLLPRYRRWLRMEKDVFAPGTKTKIMLISPKEMHAFSYFYQTETERFTHLPPGIGKDRIACEDAPMIRAKMRRSLGLSDKHIALLMVGSGFKTKGVDRSIRALAALVEPLKKRTRLYIVGNGNPQPFQKLAKKLAVDHQVNFLGGKNDVPHYLLAADLLLHPAYHENTGNVLLEAIVSGLPVLTVASCGYAHYIHESNAGLVLTSPFKQQEMNNSLEKMLLSADLKKWQRNGLHFAQTADIYHMPERAADYIETIGYERGILLAQ